jgi:hypothetical protein
MKAFPKLQKTNAKLMRLGVRHTRRGIGFTHETEHADQPAVLVAKRTVFDPAPKPIAAGMENQRQAAGGLSGNRLGRGHQAGGEIWGLAGRCRAVRRASLAQHRLGRVARKRFPGLVDPSHAESLIKPEHWLTRMLQELLQLECRNAWRRHE